MPTPSISELQRAIQISEEIQQLEGELAAILKGSASGKLLDRSPKRRGRPRKVQQAGAVDELSSGTKEVKTKRKKSKMSAEGRAKIAAAQRARWAKVKGTK